MSLYIVDIHGDLEGDYEIIRKYEEQEPKTGHWINCKCDKCGYVVQPWNTTSFCPNCGADMREVEE